MVQNLVMRGVKSQIENKHLTKFSQIWIIDSSTLEALFCKLKSLEDVPTGQL